MAGSFSRFLSLMALASCWGSGAAFAANSPEWRYWQAQQGLANTYIDVLSRTPDGAVWAIHGDASLISRFDGRSFTSMPSPFVYGRFDSIDGRNGWIADRNGLHRLEDGKWELFAGNGLPPFPANRPLMALDLGGGRALVMADRLARFSAASKQLEPLAVPASQSRLGRLWGFERSLDGKSVWVVGEKGVAHLSYGPGGAAPYGWNEYYPAGIGDLAYPTAGVSGELFLTGIQKG